MLKYRGYPLRLFPMHIEEILGGDSQLVAGRREWAMQQADQYIKNFLEKDMPQFKVGDKVKCIKPVSGVDPSFNLCGEAVFTVSKVRPLEGAPFTVFLESKPIGYEPSRFELVKEGHPHAILMARYAEVAKDHLEPWQFFQYHSHQTGEWVTLQCNPAWWPNVAYREKPKEVTASLWVAYLVHANAPTNLMSVSASTKKDAQEHVSNLTRSSMFRVVKEVHEVTETYEVL